MLSKDLDTTLMQQQVALTECVNQWKDLLLDTCVVLDRVKLPLAVKLLHGASTISFHMTDMSKVILPHATKAEEEQG